MKGIVLLHTFAIATMMALSAGCDGGGPEDQASGNSSGASSGDVQPDSAASTAVTGELAKERIDHYRQLMGNNLKQIDNAIDEVAADVQQLSGDARKQALDTVESLRAQRDALATRLEDVSADTAQAWGDLKTGLDEAWNDLKAAVDNASRRYGDRGGAANTGE